MKSLLFLALSCLSAGCYDISAWAPSLHNTVTFEPSFTDVEKAYIMHGFNLWGAETNCDARFEEAPNGRIEIKKSTYEDNLRFDKDANGEVLGLAVEGAEPKIYFAMDRLLTFQDLTLVAAHEAGHHLGMAHVPQEQLAIMNPDEPSQLVNDIHLTTYDIDQFNNFWRCK